MPSKSKTVKTTAAPVRLVVLQRGWVVVGRMRQSSSEVVIDNAAVVRRWGTSKGLGQLAKDGPTSTTVLDDCPALRVHPLAVVLAMDCNADVAAWKGRA